MIASRVVVVSEVVAELAFRMMLPGIHDVDVSALFSDNNIDMDYLTSNICTVSRLRF